jgi:hypothetical protein
MLETILLELLRYNRQAWVTFQQGMTTHHDGNHLRPETVNPVHIYHG